MLSRARALITVSILSSFVCVFAGCSSLPALRGISSWFDGRRGTHAMSTRERADAELAIDHLQIKGSHNSYHRAPWLALSPTWRYTHPRLETQLARQGVRQIELDVRYDGGRVVVGHLPIIDGRASCNTLKACLGELRAWSKKNPSHLPIFVFLEPKEHVVPSLLDGRLEVLDAEIRRVFPREELILPEDVVGDASSVQEALREHGWPTVQETRGKFAFVLFGAERHPRAYGRGRPNLAGATMFAAGTIHDPWAGVLLYDDPIRSAGAIAHAVKQHLLVRTRADADLVRDRSRRDAALASGAHFLATDFFDPRQRWLDIGRTAPVRCNPLTAPARCGTNSLASIEDALWSGLKGTSAAL